ncbi:MAG: PP2C family protein-serine/threonine phosphatase [Planctomycetaceae bacterium]
MTTPPHNEASTELVQPPPTTPGGVLEPQLSFGASTHVGLVRENNEDNYAVVHRTRSRELVLSSLPPNPNEFGTDHAYVLIVADGMGGGRAGEVASEMVLRLGWELVGRDPSWLMRFQPQLWPTVRQRLEEFATHLQQLVSDYSRTDPRLNGMGTTWTCAYVLGWHAIIAHVGDSRAYLWQRGKLTQLTKDQTMAESLIRNGLPASETVRYRHILTNAFGCDHDHVFVESHYHELGPGDRLLLCSDGLYDMVSDDVIARELASTVTPQLACDRLKDAALAAGGRDNVTLLVADFSLPDAAIGETTRSGIQPPVSPNP